LIFRGGECEYSPKSAPQGRMTMKRGLKKLSRRAASLAAALLAGATGGCVYADVLSTNATVRANNSLLVDVLVTTGANVERISITFQTRGADPLVSRLTQVSSTGSTNITIGRLRANRTYTYTVDAFDRDGAPAGTASCRRWKRHLHVQRHDITLSTDITIQSDTTIDATGQNVTLNGTNSGNIIFIDDPDNTGSFSVSLVNLTFQRHTKRRQNEQQTNDLNLHDGNRRRGDCLDANEL
jgi:hypothetical protein